MLQSRVSSVFCVAACGVIGLLGSTQAGVVFLAHFNKALDADFALTGQTSAAVKEVRLTSGKMGYPFGNSLPVPEAVDIGYSASVPAGAGLAYDAACLDVRQGTLQMWVKTSWDWSNTQQERMDKLFKNRQFFRAKLKGGIYNAINLYFACDQGHNFLPHLAFYIHDGKRDYIYSARVGSDAPTDFAWQKDTWHYLAATWTPNRIALFADGKKLGERTFEAPMDCPMPEAPFILGNSAADGQPAQALIDEVRILDFPLPDAEAMVAPTMELSDAILGQGIAAGGPTTFYRPERRRYYAYQLAAPPVIDGDLTDKAWESVPAVTGFVGLGLESKLVKYQSQVKAAWDANQLYLSVLCYEDKLDTLRAETKKSGDMSVFGDDAVELFLSAEPEGRPFLQLGINSANAACGILYPADGRRVNWEGKLSSAVKKGNGAWTVEVAIPFAEIKATPRIGMQLRWNVCRDRRASGGLEYSSMSFVSTSFLEPAEYGDLLLTGAPQAAVPVEEARLNKDYLARSAAEMREAVARVDRELGFLKDVSQKDREASGISGIEEQLRATASGTRALLAAKSPSLQEWTGSYFGLVKLQALIDAFSSKALALAVTAPPDVAQAMLGHQPGIYHEKQHLFIVSPQLVAAVDSKTGAIAGVWEKRSGTRLLVSSYDIYYAETRTREWRSDERLNLVRKAKKEKDAVTVVSTNPDLPGLEFHKRYFLAADRLLCCRTEITGKTKETVLLKLTSNSIFDEGFRQDCFYDRVFVIGTTGEQRQQVFAREIKEPVMQRAWFNATEGRAQFAAVNPKSGIGLGQYLYKIDDRWSYPQGLAQSWWHQFGWEMGGAGEFFRAGVRKTTSCELRYHLFIGDRLTFHREYLALPEHQAVMTDWTPHPWAAKMVVYGAPHLEWGLASMRKASEWLASVLRPDEVTVGLTNPSDNQWGVFPAADGETVVMRNPATGKEERKLPSADLKKMFATMHQTFPWAKLGVYRFISDLYKGGNVYKEHPEWILKDKQGKDLPGVFDQYCAAVNFHPAYLEYLLNGLLKSADYYGEDMVYLDFCVGCWFVDWGREEVAKINVFADWLKRLHTELAKRNKLLWLNSFVDQYYYDIGFHEGDNCRDPWRVSANVWMMRKIYTRKGNVCVPLYWKGGDMFVAEGGANEERYRNLVLASGLKSSGCYLDPYDKHFPDPKSGADWAAVCQYQFAVHAATSELIPSQFVDIGLAPAWWRDFTTEYEAYTLRQGASWLLNVISHEKDVRDAEFSLDPKQMGLDPGRPVFVWHFYAREQKDYVKQVPLPAGWDRVFKDCRLQTLSASDGPLKITLDKLVPETVRMACFTQVPGFIYAASGERTQLLLSDNLGAALTGTLDERGRTVTLKVSATQPVQVLAYWDAAWGDPAAQTKAGETLPCRQETVGGRAFALIDAKAGESEMVISAKAK